MTLFRGSISLPHHKRLASGRSSTVSVIDVGSTKICSMIARLQPKAEGSELVVRSHSVEVLGFGHQRSRGIKSGVVTDMDEAEDALRQAIDSAERSSGVTVDSLIVSVSAGRLASDTFSSSVVLGEREVSRHDIRDAISAGHDHVYRDDRLTLHALPIGYGLDGEAGIDNPVSMSGRELSVDMHMVSAELLPLRNLEACINRSHLAVDAMVAAPYASGLATLMADEMRMGCACIDMGGGTTTVSIFLAGQLVHVDAIAVGGNHVTSDLARVLSTAIADAERMKVLHGTALPGEAGGSDMITIAPVGGDDGAVAQQISAADISRIIAPRVEETFEFVRDRLRRSGFAGAVKDRIVLTGGASQLSGVNELAGRILGSQVRHGRPMGVSGMPNTAKGPAFSTVAGLLIYPQLASAEYSAPAFNAAHHMPRAGKGTLSRMGRWLRQNF